VNEDNVDEISEVYSASIFRVGVEGMSVCVILGPTHPWRGKGGVFGAHCDPEKAV
jgi:hypothetical protein